MTTVSEERFMAHEKEVNIFKAEVHKQDLKTVDALGRIEVLLKGVTDGVSRKGAMGYGGGTAGIIVGIVEVFRLVLS